MSISEERQQGLEAEMMAAKDAIWRLTTRVFHLEKQVKDLKLVLRYTAKGCRRRGAKVAEMDRLKKSKKLTMSKGKGVAVAPNVQQQPLRCIKAEPMSSGGEEEEEEEGWGGSVGQSGATPWNSFFCESQVHSEEDSDSNSSDVDVKVCATKVRKGMTKCKTEDGSGVAEKKRGKGRSKSPTWEYFVVENTRYRNKDTLATCKTCRKHFAWPKIERLRKHVKVCSSTAPPPPPFPTHPTAACSDVILCAPVHDASTKHKTQSHSDT